jgi:LPS sulfotransferase NodH
VEASLSWACRRCGHNTAFFFDLRETLMDNFLLVGTQRTGSSALAKLINMHEKILSGLEWTQKIPRGKKIKIAKEILSGNFTSFKGFDKNYVEKKNKNEIKWIGFKILFSSSNKWVIHPKFSIPLWADHFNEHLKWFKRNPDVHIIHIIRKNNIEWLKSVFLAKETKIYSGNVYPDGIKIEINIKNAIMRIKSKDWIDNSIQKLKKTNPYCQISYEKLLKDPKNVAKITTNFLKIYDNIDFDKFKSIKQSKGHAQNYIKNFSELFKALEREDLLFSKD